MASTTVPQLIDATVETIVRLLAEIELNMRGNLRVAYPLGYAGAVNSLKHVKSVFYSCI